MFTSCACAVGIVARRDGHQRETCWAARACCVPGDPIARGSLCLRVSLTRVTRGDRAAMCLGDEGMSIGLRSRRVRVARETRWAARARRRAGDPNEMGSVCLFVTLANSSRGRDGDPGVIRLWRSGWNEVVPFLSYPALRGPKAGRRCPARRVHRSQRGDRVPRPGCIRSDSAKAVLGDRGWRIASRGRSGRSAPGVGPPRPERA